MKKRNIILIILSILFLIIPFFINKYSVIRLISVIIGMIIFSLSFSKLFKKYRYIEIVLLFGCLLVLTYYSDYFVSKYLSRIPLYSIEKRSSSKMKTYNSLGYRIYNCNKKLIFDSKYQKKYPCGNNDIKVMEVNKLLSSGLDNYLKYDSKFVHIKGKISTIIGSSSLILNYYDISDTTINGFVVFDENKKLIIDNLDIDPKDYYIYDNVEVIGIVYNYISNKDGFELHLKDAKVIKSDIYDDYELSVTNLNDKEYIKKTDNIYYLGIEGIYFKYDKDVIYELSYLLNDNRQTIDNLINGIEAINIDELSVKYELKDFNIIKCNKDKYIFANKNINTKKICNIEN